MKSAICSIQLYMHSRYICDGDGFRPAPQLFHRQSKHQPEIGVQFTVNASSICTPEARRNK